MINFKQYLASATAAALIATSVLSGGGFTAQATTAPTTTNENVVVASTFGAMPFVFLKEDKTGPSTGMMRNVKPTAQIEKAADGKTYAYITATNSQYWADFKVKVNDELVAASVISNDETNKTRLYKFEVNALTDVLESEITIDTGGGRAPMIHKVYFDFQNESISDQEFKAWDEKLSGVSRGVTNQLYTTAQTEVIDGKKYAYITLKSANVWQNFSANLTGEFTNAEVVYENTVNNTRIVKVEIPTENRLVETISHIKAVYPGGSHEAKYVTYFDFNNFYSVENTEEVSIGKKSYKAWDASLTKETSMAKYSSTPAEFLVVNGQKYIQMTLNTTDQFKEMQTEVNGTMTNVIEISRDDEAKTRVVRFPVESFKKNIKANAHVVVEAQNYDANHTYYLDFAQLVTNVKDLEFKSYNADKTVLVDTSALLKPTVKVRTYEGKTKAIVSVVNREILTGVKVKIGEALVDATVLSDGGKWSKAQTIEIELPDYEKETVEVQLTTKKEDVVSTETVQLDLNNLITLPEVTPTPEPTPEPEPTPTPEPTEKVTVVEAAKAFKIWDSAKEKESMLQSYMSKPAKIIKINNKQYAEITTTSANFIHGMKLTLDGKVQEATIVSEDKKANTRVYRFALASYKELIKADIHVIVPNVYDTTHTTYFDFNETAVDGEDEVVTPTKPVTPEKPVTPAKPVDKVVSTTKYNYSLVTKSKKSKSAAAGYMTNPMKVEKTKSGKYYATVTLKNASMWKSVKTEVNGKMVTVKTVSTNKAKNTKVVKFQVKSPTATTKTTFTLKTSIKVNKKAIAGNYTNYVKVGKKYVAPPKVTSTKKYNYTVVKSNKKTTSVTDRYFSGPTTVVKMSDGKYYATVTLKNASMFKSMKANVNGKMVAVKTVSTNKAKNTKNVKFQVKSPKATTKVTFTLNTKVKVDKKAIAGKYTNYVKVGSTYVAPPKVTSTKKYNYTVVKSNKKTTSVADRYFSGPTTVVKMSDGKYYATVTLKNASMFKSMKANVNGKMVTVKTVSTNKAKNTKNVKFQVKSPKATTKVTFTLNTKIKVNKKAIAGKYTNYVKVGSTYVAPPKVTSTKKYSYKVLKDDKKSTSVTNKYVTGPAIVEKMSNGKYYATITLKNGTWWKSFKTDVSGKMTAVKTVSTNKAKNTRTVKFQIASPTKQVKSALHIKNTTINYEGKYTTYFKFGKVVK